MHVADIGRDAFVVEVEADFVIDDQIAAARAGLQAFQFFEQGFVVLHEFEVELENAFDKTVLNHQLAAHRLVDLRVVDPATRDERQTEQRHSLETHCAASSSVPLGVAVGSLDQMPGQRLDPVGIDPRVAADVTPRRLDQLAGDEPFDLLADESRARPENDFLITGGGVFGSLAAHCDVADEARQQRSVNRVGIVATLARSQTGFLNLRAKLLMDIDPLAQPVVREEVLLAGFSQLAARKIARQMMKEVPEFEVAQEVRVRVLELLMSFVGGLLLVDRTIARVLLFEPGGDDEHLGQTVLVVTGEDDSPDSRINRHAAELETDLGEFVLLVDRSEFEECAIAVIDRAGLRGFQERKIFDRAELERLRLQDDRGQIRALNLGRSEGLAGVEVFLRIQPDANARPDSTAAPGSLTGRGLRDGLDRQALHPRAGRVPTDPRRAGINDVADAGDGQRGLGDVGRDHDATLRMRLEDAVLVFVREAGIERQDFGRSAFVVLRKQAASQRLRGLVNVALGRHEEQDVARIQCVEFFNGIQDRALNVGLAASSLLLVLCWTLSLSGCGRGFVRVVGLVFDIVGQRSIADLDGIRSARDFDHRSRSSGRTEVLGKAGGVDRRRGDDDLQFGTSMQELLQATEQEVDVERSLMRLVDDDRVVGVEVAVVLRLGQQDAVGHEFDVGLRAG